MSAEINDFLVPDIGYLIYRKCTPTWEIAKNEISFCDITYIIEGRGIYTINGVQYEVKRGDLLCIPRGSIRMARCIVDDLMNVYSANFKLYDMDGQQADLPLPLLTHIGIKSDLVGLFRELSNAWVRKETGYHTKTRGLLLVIMHRLYELILLKKDTARSDYRVKKAINYISENYASNVTVKEIANLVGLNTVYFGALFKNETGILVNQYLTQTRINHAEDMLQNGECNVTEAAERCGYSDLSHFRKQFKMIKGYSPSQCLRNQPD
ncbi:HTH-type transcriptional activator RhaS [Paenibacillus allorhizoplanae]|uniref:HTH-type transcriptional activator RhaS n=1 Tax=Paenibacillus allorhizoplanae TaxID=2905648 RepID=A0ABM9BR73_9BACL|nr:AraC family transcriptional regulator [Paenibacillus allorhizoplanae]CAH1192624.1 HTH-type transcriptional activator RhaS [Paenibacillus allorhizoplanae]